MKITIQKNSMNILFDLDGTLTDSFEGITKCIFHAMTQLGKPVPPPETLGRCIGPPLKKSFARLLDSQDDGLAEQALILYRERFASVGLFENRVYDHIPQVLGTLKGKGHNLYVATAKPEIYAKRIIRHFDLDKYFKHVYGSELDGTRTDKTTLIAHILDKESLSADESVMVGDREHDMVGAGNNGLPGLGVLWGYGTREALENSGAYACLDDPRELVDKISYI
ncbi:phosphoglycolate phosphatase [Desulfocicer vacuolatum DSM 3385]|uniref:Phosphoglycolate phosphatase n=2 Tax=Desulfocicer vacuolatum TaxID=2298 RepID=A0A1W2AWD8_9BACT|nr:phosphoglycolate phosphatase [Desulfocicer vacuolatum DSM 3385]